MTNTCSGPVLGEVRPDVVDGVALPLRLLAVIHGHNGRRRNATLISEKQICVVNRLRLHTSGSYEILSTRSLLNYKPTLAMSSSRFLAAKCSTYKLLCLS